VYFPFAVNSETVFKMLTLNAKRIGGLVLPLSTVEPTGKPVSIYVSTGIDAVLVRRWAVDTMNRCHRRRGRIAVVLLSSRLILDFSIHGEDTCGQSHQNQKGLRNNILNSIRQNYNCNKPAGILTQEKNIFMDLYH
jgi:hypothetical protein